MIRYFLTALCACGGLTWLLAAPSVHAQSSSLTVVTSNFGGPSYTGDNGLYRTLFVGTANGFAVASTSPNFGGSSMATASSTQYGHYADAELTQSFQMPSFIASGRITLDFQGQAFATGNALAYIGYRIEKPTSNGTVLLGFGNARSTTLSPELGTPGAVKLSARRTFTLLGGESIVVNTRAIADTGFSEGYVFYTPGPGPGYATAFMDPVVSYSAAIPEPATWGLLIAGFGMTGFALRNRRGLVGSAARKRRTAQAIA